MAPQIFDVDDDGVGQVLVDEVASDDLEDTHDAVLGCPENAITLTE
jgi:ferredoxin